MGRDVLTADLRSLTTQAEAVVAQLSVTHALTEALATSSVDSSMLQRLLSEAAAEARAAAIDRGLADTDVGMALYEAEKLVVEANLWRVQLRSDLVLVARADPAWEHDVGAVLPLLRPRLRRLKATTAWMMETAPALVLRARVFDGAAAHVAEGLRRAQTLATRLAEVSARYESALQVRHLAATRVDALRGTLQDRLRLARHGWALAQARNRWIPDLDLTVVASAVAQSERRSRAPIAHEPADTCNEDVATCSEMADGVDETMSTCHEIVSTTYETLSIRHEAVSVRHGGMSNPAQ